MDFFRVVLKPSAERELRKLPRHVVARVAKLVSMLEENPYPRNVEKLAGSDELYRVRLGDYRIVFTIDTINRIVSIYRIRHRKEAYRKF